MINVSKELKEAFLSAQQKNLVLTFDDGVVIDNDDIALECMELEQTLCDSDELQFGKVSSACFKTKIMASTKRYKNLWFNASICVGEYAIPLGRFRVYTDNMTSDRLYREIVAYDSLFWASNTDVTEWYNGLSFPISQKAFRDSLFAYLGIEQEAVVLPNDNIIFNQTVNAESLTGLSVLQKLCEINATWGVINNDGRFKYARMRTHEHDALYPSDDLYPGDDVYPNDIYDDRLSKADYYQGSLTYEEFDVKAISKVTIRENSEDFGYSYGVDGNTYVIEDNFLLYGATNSTLQTVAKNFIDYASYIDYTPAQLKCKGAPWREVGDLLRVVADKRTLTVPILNRQLSGITAMNDTYIARGTETCGEVKNNSSEKLKQLQSRTNKLSRTLDETRSEISEVKTDLAENYSTTEQMQSVISQTADNISLEVSKNLENYSTTEKMYSAIKLNANTIISEVNNTYETKEEAQTNYATLTQTANFISLKVGEKIGTDEVVSSINMSTEQIELKNNRIIVDSTNFKVSKEGIVTATDGKFEGKITATSGKIGNWNIYTNGYLGSAGKRNGKWYGIALDPSETGFVENQNVLAIGHLGKGGEATADAAIRGTGTTWANAAFRIKADGSVVANDLTTSKIIATGGRIGGWELSDKHLKGGDSLYTVEFLSTPTYIDGDFFFIIMYKYGTQKYAGLCQSGWKMLTS